MFRAFERRRARALPSPVAGAAEERLFPLRRSRTKLGSRGSGRYFRNLPRSARRSHTESAMSNFPHPPDHSRHPQRPTRVRPTEYTPAVLRVEDGSCTQATLEIYSLTGGLLSLRKPLNRGARARLIFLTEDGPVLGLAEMLMPVSWTEQPFRFVGLNEDDEHRLRAATQPAAQPAAQPAKERSSTAAESAPKRLEPPTGASEPAPTLDAEAPWIEKYRAAIDGNVPQPRSLRKIFLAALTAVTLGAGLLVCVLQSHLLR